LYDDART